MAQAANRKTDPWEWGYRFDLLRNLWTLVKPWALPVVTALVAAALR